MNDAQVLKAQDVEAAMWQAFDVGDQKQVAHFAQILSSQFATFASGWYSKSQILYRQKQLKPAFDCVKKALYLDPNNVAYRLHQAMLIAASGNYQSALGLLKLIPIASLKTDYQLSTAGRIFSMGECHHEALECYQRATELAPNEYDHWYNLATVARFVGDKALAISAIKRSLALKPGDAHSVYLLSQIDVEQLEAVYSTIDQTSYEVMSPKEQVYIQFAMGTLAEKKQHYDVSFDHIQNANKLRRAHINYSVDRDIEIINRLVKEHDQDFVSGCTQGASSNAPIFIVGLPRTGTTLIERAISSADDVVSVGESNAFNIAMARLAKDQGGNGDLITSSKKIDSTKLGQAYLEQHQTDGGQRFIDKLPMNSLNVGLIATSLPNASIVWVRRSYADTLWAIYKTLFESAYPYSYSLDELTEYLIAHHKLMSHWQAVLKDRLICIDYEHFVSDADQASKQLASNLKLQHVEEMASPEKNDSPSSTASATQVREPVHNKSVGLWLRYQSQLQPYVQRMKDTGLPV